MFLTIPVAYVVVQHLGNCLNLGTKISFNFEKLLLYAANHYWKSNTLVFPVDEDWVSKCLPPKKVAVESEVETAAGWSN